jgi:metallophosphoesterase superfamily enzyme
MVAAQAVLLAHAHPCVDRQQKMGQKLCETAFYGGM